MTQTKPGIRLINSSSFVCMVGDDWTPSYLVLLLEAVALRTLHLGDVLEEVGHADGRVQLTCLVRHVHRLALPQGVSVRLHQAAGVAAHVLALICRKGGGGAEKQGKRSRSGLDWPRTRQYSNFW